MPIVENRGTDVELDFIWKNPDGTIRNLTGWTPVAMDASPEIADFLTVELGVDPEDGEIFCRIEWDDSFEANVLYQFRVQLQDDPEHRSTNLIEVIYQ